MMNRITVGLEENHERIVQEVIDGQGGAGNQSEAIRHIIEFYEAGQNNLESQEQQLEEAQERIEELKRENEQLRSQLQATNSRIDEHQELVEYVEDEQRVRRAPIWKRAKWWVVGAPG
jgi:predicted  nucleic acid-binding Zn-ribbon protein